MELAAFILFLSLLVNVSNSKFFLVETGSKEEIKNEAQDFGGADYGWGTWKRRGNIESNTSIKKDPSSKSCKKHK